MEALLSLFPDRPLRLTRRIGGWRTPRLFAIIGAVLLIPTLIAAWYLAGEYELRRTLRERGVTTTTLSLDGECRTRARSRETSCTALARYVVQPAHGGGVREATVVFHRRPMAFMGTLPSMVYDPGDPSRAIPREELRNGPSAGYFIALGAPGLLALTFFGAGLSAWSRARNAAIAEGYPAFIPVRNLLRSTANEFTLVYDDPRTGRLAKAYYDTGVLPFVVTDEAGAMQVLALASGDGQVYPLDSRLTFVDLDDAERRAVLGT